MLSKVMMDDFPYWCTVHDHRCNSRAVTTAALRKFVKPGMIVTTKASIKDLKVGSVGLVISVPAKINGDGFNQYALILWGEQFVSSPAVLMF